MHSNHRRSACSDADCVLMDFMPKECRYEAVPCRRIPQNETGETVDGLYRTATNEEIERALRQWLLTTIKRLEHSNNQLNLEYGLVARKSRVGEVQHGS